MFRLLNFLLAHNVAGSLVACVPFVETTYRDWVWSRGMNHFSGVFSSHQAAIEGAPKRRSIGWNDSGIAEAIVSEIAPGPVPPMARLSSAGIDVPVGIAQTSTFAVLAWLSKTLRPNMRVVDVGGAGGITYWLYRRYFDLPEGVVWTVVDFPELVERGRAAAHSEAAAGLRFETDLAAAGNADILMALGSLQYMSPAEVDAFFNKADRTDVVIVNKIALVAKPAYWTLQNLVSTSAPYWIANGREFIGRLQSGGLKIRDAWEVPEISISIPFRPGHGVERLAGFFLSREADNVQ